MNKKMLLLIYCVIGSVWIFGTNFLLDQFQPSSLTYAFARTKEIIYVIASGWIFYYFISRTEELNASREEERRLSTLINSMIDFVNFKDGQGRWIEANEFGLKLFNLEHVDYKGKTDIELAEHTDFFKPVLEYCQSTDEQTWNSGEIMRFEDVITKEDGTIKTFDTIKVPLFHKNGNRRGIVVMGRDITERKRVEGLLFESQQQYKSLFQYNTEVILMTNLECEITNVNPQFNLITGFESEETIGKQLTEFVVDRYQEVFPQMMETLFKNPEPLFGELELRSKNDDIITLQCTVLPMIVNGKIDGIICHGKDVTRLRQAEEKLLRAEKLSVVGELSASIAHEIRNPLTSLKGFVQLLETEDEKHKLYFQIMQEELDRINDIVGELLLLAKPQQIKFKEADVQAILYNVISLLKTEASLHNIQIKFPLQSESFLIECEPNQLKQLFINIIKNALEASASDNIVQVSLTSEVDQVVISVKDNGCGISAERLKKIGEPFYSSKEKGTGLGLTVSHKIVQSHNGTIHFQSEENSGTEVIVTLPVKNMNSHLLVPEANIL